jgi:hypothetical protein
LEHDRRSLRDRRLRDQPAEKFEVTFEVPERGAAVNGLP